MNQPLSETSRHQQADRRETCFTSHSRTLRIALSWTALAIATSNVAKAATEPTAPTKDVIVLSPFEIDASADKGYQASSTLAGSRLNTRLKDTAAPISIFTDQLLADLGVTSFDELAEWSVGTEQTYNEDTGNQNNLQFSTGHVTVRGLPAASGRNYYQWELSTDFFNTERVELSSGPNAILFGLGSPGGMFNSSTKRAQTNRNFFTIENRVGSYHLLRTSFDWNQTLLKDKLALRLNVLRQESESWRDWEWNDSKRAHLATTFRMRPKMVLRAEWEVGQVRMNTPRTFSTQLSHHPWTDAHRAALIAAGGNPDLIPEGSAGGFFNPYRGGATFTAITPLPNTVEQQLSIYPVYNTATGVFYNAEGEIRNRDPAPIEQVWDDPYIANHVWVKGPHDYRTQDLVTYTFAFETQLLDNLFLDLGFNSQRNRFDHKNNTANFGLQVDLNKTMPDGSPNPDVGRYYLESVGQDRVRNLDRETLRAVLSYEIDLTNRQRWFGRHRFAGLFEKAKINTDNARLSLAVSENHLTGFNASSLDATTNWVNYRTYVDIDNSSSLIWGGPTFLVNEPIRYSTPRFLRPNLGERSITGERISTEWSRSLNEDKTFDDDMRSSMVVMQNYWFNNRLITGYGIREEILDRQGYIGLPQTDPRGRVIFGPADPEHYRNLSRSFNTVFHLNRAGTVSLFYNTGSNFRTPDPLHLVVGLSSPPVGRGTSKDIGLKFDLFKGKVSGSVLHFKTIGINLTENAGRPMGLETIINLLNTANRGYLDPDGVPLTNATVGKWNTIPNNAVVYDNESEGYELNLVANPTESLRVFFNYSRTETLGANAGKEMVAYLDRMVPYAEQFIGQIFTGTRDDVLFQLETVYDHLYNSHFSRNGYAPRGFNKEKANFRTTYSWTEGLLKGVSVGGGLQWRSPPVIGNRTEGGRADGTVPLWRDAKPFNFTSNTPILGQDEWITSLSLGYETRLKIGSRNVRANFQINVDNLLNDTDPIVTWIAPTAGQDVVRGYRFVRPRQINLTTTLKF